MPAPTGFTLVTASKIQDGSGRLLASGRVTFFPVNGQGQSISAIAGGGGVIIATGVSFLVVNGAITTDLYGNTPQIADSSLTTPVNLLYRVTITDATGSEVQGPGYGMVQPSGLTFSLDNMVPNQPALAVVQTGPPGATGPAGGVLGGFSQVPTGAVDGVNRTFVVATPPLVLWLTRNGLFQTPGTVQAPGVDYSLTGNTITYFTAPPIGDKHYAQGIY